jgi:CheY-like chemotaxis protein
MMDGTIDVQSKYGVGSTFTVRIKQKQIGEPVIGTELSDKLRNFSFSHEKESAKLQIRREYMPYGKVLIVDDVETNLFVAEGLMKPYGLHIDLARSGMEAIRIIEKGSLFDVIFMDHMMPQMDGIECTQRLRDMGYDGTIIALTANAIAGSSQMFLEHGMDNFISKPIDLRILNTMLNKYIRDKYREYADTDDFLGVIPDSYDNNDELKQKLISVFIKDSRNALSTLKTTFEYGDFKLFSITAHGIKSACANVGNINLSEMAKELEFAGKENKKDLIAEKLPVFLEKLQSYLEELSPAPAENSATNTVNSNEQSGETTGVIAFDAVFINDKLLEIAFACDNFDEMTAEPIIKELEKTPCPPDIKEKIESVSELILFSEFEQAANICREIINASTESVKQEANTAEETPA